MKNNRYHNSNKLIEDALDVIPLGSQTFSKSITAFPKGVSPLFIEKGLMSKVWDIDGNEYIDFINGLASVTLGYSNEEINNKVFEQLEKESEIYIPKIISSHPLAKERKDNMQKIISETVYEIKPNDKLNSIFEYIKN